LTRLDIPIRSCPFATFDRYGIYNTYYTIIMEDWDDDDDGNIDTVFGVLHDLCAIYR
jgi:hypothetical protein